MRCSIIFLLTVSLILAACNDRNESNFISTVAVTEQQEMTKTLRIQIAGDDFTVNLSDNPAVQVFLAQLPITLEMKDLNNNEKYYFLSEDFPTNSEAVGSIQAGDFMLYGSDCIVLFYQSFSTSYHYTKLGAVEDAAGLSAALGGGNVIVTFSLAD